MSGIRQEKPDPAQPYKKPPLLCNISVCKVILHLKDFPPPPLVFFKPPYKNVNKTVLFPENPVDLFLIPLRRLYAGSFS